MLSVTNLATFQQTWFNPQRGSKPQTFQRSSLEAAQSTAQHGSCDFCQWETCTGEDDFGRSGPGQCPSAPWCLHAGKGCGRSHYLRVWPCGALLQWSGALDPESCSLGGHAQALPSLRTCVELVVWSCTSLACPSAVPGQQSSCNTALWACISAQSFQAFGHSPSPAADGPHHQPDAALPAAPLQDAGTRGLPLPAR